ncbi:D-2-hydroxyacid dehydrogenase [Cryobacterium sp. PH29-G1]|uniref:D-2-hydroxyacid dehydrogenase n=1 Tax=Cryobacterium sp. PH29-G1 TaxID=3046211 RepID=UPI0024BB7765|nr:D-2-hydroxyacid dehydrogenase [Cryobacterium sp. PH29-G1]MDJ0348597.1 D-2-hydroxyacid dehydrogenase [Cryobacterium sp. PH29-G1]
MTRTDSLSGVSDPAVHRPIIVVLCEPIDAPKPAGMAALELVTDVRYTDAAGLPDAIESAEILLLWDFFSSALQEAWPRAQALKWVHVAAAGVDTVLFDEFRRSGVVLTNAHGFFDGPIAEFVLATILAHDKDLHRSRALQRGHEWEHRESRRTAGSTALIVGTGGIGRQIARLLRAVGLEVRGSGRRASSDDPDFGIVVPSAALAEHVGWADNVVVIAPLTSQTRGMIDAGVFGAMKASAHLINVARGPLVDEAALLQALRTGQIAAASLDVFVTEPLPTASPLWDIPGVTVSAHMAGDVVGWRDGLAEQFTANVARWLAGDELVNVVDKSLGYVARG